MGEKRHWMRAGVYPLVIDHLRMATEHGMLHRNTPFVSYNTEIMRGDDSAQAVCANEDSAPQRWIRGRE